MHLPLNCQHHVLSLEIFMSVWSLFEVKVYEEENRWQSGLHQSDVFANIFSLYVVDKKLKGLIYHIITPTYFIKTFSSTVVTIKSHIGIQLNIYHINICCQLF